MLVSLTSSAILDGNNFFGSVQFILNAFELTTYIISLLSRFGSIFNESFIT